MMVMKPKKLPNIEVARNLLTYDSVTGFFAWAIDRTGGNGGLNARKGDAAGYINTQGYCTLQIDGCKYLAHRIAWLLTYGEPVPDYIDHKNRNKDDNRLCNLRGATKSLNGYNRLLAKNNTSGYRGITWDKARQQWQVKIGRKHFGRHESLDEAISIYNRAVAFSGLLGILPQIWTTPSLTEIH